MKAIPKNPIDLHVGARVRLRRMTFGMSQERLGKLLDVTFQQVQKYERGVNRIGAGRLFNIGCCLDVPVSFFFEGLPQTPLESGSAMSVDAMRIALRIDALDCANRSAAISIIAAVLNVFNKKRMPLNAEAEMETSDADLQ